MCTCASVDWDMGTIVIDTGYGHLREVKKTLFKVVTQITITNQAITQKNMVMKEIMIPKSPCFKKQRNCDSNKRDANRTDP